MYDDTITVFNHRGEYWFPTVFEGADLKVTTASNITASGINNVGDVSIIIHISKNKGIRSGKRYIDPMEFQTVEDPENFYTFKPEDDFIVVGEYYDIENDEDYDSGFYHEMNATKDGVYKIQAAAWYSLLPHFEIGAR